MSGMRVRQGVVALVLVASGGCSPTADTGTYEDFLAGSDVPQGAQVVMPTRLPDGYSADSSMTNGGAMSFACSNREDPVQVCVVPSGTELVGTCIPTGRPDTPILARQSFDAFEAVVVLRGSGEVGSVEAWQDIPLTTKWQDVGWVNAPRP